MGNYFSANLTNPAEGIIIKEIKENFETVVFNLKNYNEFGHHINCLLQSEKEVFNVVLMLLSSTVFYRKKSTNIYFKILDTIDSIKFEKLKDTELENTIYIIKINNAHYFLNLKEFLDCIYNTCISDCEDIVYNYRFYNKHIQN